MDRYQPEFELISCGFDAHKDDSWVGLGLQDEDYAEMTKICVEIAEIYAKGRIVSVLEGGYNLDAIASAAKAHVQALRMEWIGRNLNPFWGRTFQSQMGSWPLSGQQNSDVRRVCHHY